ncbi:MAG TPA: 50S ribosomal protein L32 [Candidatus Vogelbacteria bacterium]|uniref:Large ribosomal subunit protein bL32 n=1 Tax=Candidatus Vogelbacteria bacterium RIFOXYD1_FULL_51_18 TaxID=1802440 RepID=A0A1G2QIA4_9BACT|nr:MAG: 50S ribosomal protein L32 [Parcubacteria group bacterium GW2011_GWB1_53_43]OHA60364.1 MAG: 50S ribosomal protein L32 [Candidatus Vogelbacteria bacterium RIFOXYD1_FULL_51_18]HBB65149.1 50S ribosomal protein L32 [Candidatus Vogelbacteria bacterium]HBC44044.1 50S ribosomal protein L32 [Candidatus Vogelbacteria bacterium]HCQ91863.1 50S ribosomal protein L32 [Candidatus Vogelbacteria bacterium]
MSVRMRHTRAHTANRRSHHAIEGVRLSTCLKCGALHVRHRVCLNCGSYRGREVLNVLAKVEKRQERMRKREAAASK